MPGAPDLSRWTKRGFLKGNRPLIILLLDVLFITILLFFIRQFLYTPEYEARLAGYDLTLRGFPLKEKVIASLLVRKKSENAFSGRIFVRFTFKGEDLRLSRELPEAMNMEVELAGSLERPGLERPEGSEPKGSEMPVEAMELIVEVQIGKEGKTLRRTMEPVR